ncbi:stage III sporulation protein AG [Peribacillus deserti]|uniref:Stage III sporulation protein AG n=1 Tax=Peribacillus deserti TaxID=673318 RepID=A0A2N5M460_9BACI|nr:stage III sporulation protein AG [Peribacillus deserti]PLT29156.1 stage III sporulation protein AG [Peribacillus deserti]
MKDDKGPFSLLAKLLKKEKGPGKPSKHAYVLAVLVIGVGFMIASSFLTNTETSTTTMGDAAETGSSQSKDDVAAFGMKKATGKKMFTDYEKQYETLLKEALEDVAGIEDVTVMVNVDSSEKKVYEKNKVTRKQITNEEDRDGGKRQVEDSSVDEQLVFTRDGESEVPLVTQTQKPSIRGVLIVAKGADNIQVKKWIREAVTRVLDVSSHRVSVLAKK